MRAATLLGRAATPLILLAVATVLGGCPSISWHRAPPSTKLDRPVDIQAPGPLVLAGAGITFPQRVHGFVRRTSWRYDAEGNDIDVGYTCARSDAIIEVTIYVYPCAVPPAAAGAEVAHLHLDGVVAEIERRNGDFEIVRRTDGSASFRETTYRRAAAEVAHAGGPAWFGRPLIGTATVIPAGDWWIKTRVTAPREVRVEALEAVDDLLAELELPPTGLPTRPD